MEILNKENYFEYELFCKSFPLAGFQQSINWAEVKKGWKSEIIVVRNDEYKIIAGMLILIRKMGAKSYMYANRGPVCDYKNLDVLKELYEGVLFIAKKHKAFKFIMDPLVEEHEEEVIQNFINAGFKIDRNAPFHKTIQPRYSYQLRYLKGLSYDDLLLKMSRDTRYNMRLYQKKGVVCKDMGLLGINDFYEIYSETSARQKFTPRPKSYFENMLNAFGDNAKLFMCYYEDEALCGGIGIQYSDMVSHVYGCSTDKMRNLRPTYAVQVELMKWALNTNCSSYDMQGVSPSAEYDEGLHRVLKFKSNFTGEIVECVGEFYLIFDKIYDLSINTALEVRKMLKKKS